MNPSYNEREVLALLQDPSTQKKAFTLIVDQYSEQLYWQIRRMVLSHEDANDLLQNTFLKAWANIDYFRAEAKISTWLYRIALNECLSFLNKRRATRLARRPRGRRPATSGERPLLLGRQSPEGPATCPAHPAREATHGVQPEILPRNEVRGNVRSIRHIGRCPQGLLPPCRKEDRKTFARRLLNLCQPTTSNQNRKEEKSQ